MAYYAYATPQRARTYSHSYAYPTQPAPHVVYPTSSHSHPSPSRRHTYAQPGAYAPSPQYLAPGYQYSSHHHHTTGHHRSPTVGYRPTASPSRHHHYQDSSRRSPTHHHHHTSSSNRRSASAHAPRASHARSHSVPRNTSPRVVDYGAPHVSRRVRLPLLTRPPPRTNPLISLLSLPQSASRPRETVAFDTSAHHRRGSHSGGYMSGGGEPLGERIRRLFGFGHSSHRDRHTEYADPRTGRSVDWRGRPIFRY